MNPACILTKLETRRQAIACADLGTRRTGIALAHPPEWIALPLTTIHADTFAKLFDPLHALILERDCGAVVLGLPLLLDGSYGDQARWTQKFARFFSWRCDLPLFWQDERYSSEAAVDGARALGLRAANRHSGKDAAEASLILADFLQQQQSP